MPASGAEILDRVERYHCAARALAYMSMGKALPVREAAMPNTCNDTGLNELALVNRIFAVELYLKTLLFCRNGEFPHTHDLLRLYRRITGSLCTWQPRIKTAREIFEVIRDYFEKWRYSFEEDAMAEIAKRDEVFPEVINLFDCLRDHARSSLNVDQ